jgi:hypothetical protein
MNRKGSRRTRSRDDLAVLVFGVLGLAASPAALAHDRGGPGQPGAHDASSDGFSFLRKHLPKRLVSSD